DLADVEPSQGVNLAITASGNTGWSATASHDALDAASICAVFVGDAAAVAPAVTAGIVTCVEN
ncbi:MAG TPA: hypothetical protein VFU06_02250, partial [Longimicrobiales bacterium]|nr:hypothetical protein [Longimicrobiales bacterium]